MKNKNLSEKYKLPKSIKVEVKRDKDILYAYLSDYPGCMTIAKNLGELIENVNDAILTYFKVSKRDAKQSNIIYFPDIRPVSRISARIVKSPQLHQLRALQFVPISSQCFYA